MGARLSVTLVEDVGTDAELVIETLRRAGFDPHCRLVDDRRGYLAALDEDPDVVIADFSLPGFGALEALEIAQARNRDLPVIVVTGSLGDEVAAECIQRGASDYVLKDRLSRLGAAVQQALERRRLREQALRMGASYRAIFENAAVGIAHTDLDGRFVMVNARFAEIVGYTPGEAEQLTFRDVTHPDDLPASVESRSRLIDGTLASFEREARLRRKDGGEIWVQVATSAVHGPDGRPLHFISVLHDVTGRKEQEIRIARLSRVQAVLSGIDAVVIRERNREALFAEVCRIAVDVGGFRTAWAGIVDREAACVRLVAARGIDEEYLGRIPMGLDERSGNAGMAARAVKGGGLVVVDDMAADPRVVLHAESAARGIRSLAMVPLSACDEVGGALALYASETGFFDEDEQALLSQLGRNVGFALDALEKSERLDYLTCYDPLTGLPNRTLFHDRLSRSLHGRNGEQPFAAVVLIDIERLQRVNDTLGRQAGDDLLRQVASRLQHANESVAHVGVDMFALVLRGARSAAEVGRTVEAVAAACFGEPFRVGGEELSVACRIGISLHPSDGDNAEALLRNAEAALRRSKQVGERLVFYAPEMNARVAEALSTENKLRRALERNEFVLHYQPKVALPSGRVTSVEALLRWEDPEQGLVPPVRFIPILEESGLIAEVGAWAIEQALRDVAGWASAGCRVPSVAVNVSAVQLQRKDFADVVTGAVSRAGGRPELLELEITESLLMRDMEQGIRKLGILRSLGIALSMDDFGTGYSSLSYLARLPIDKVKVDRSFVMGIVDSPESAAIVEGIIALVHSLKRKVIAEGVETAEQAARLAALGCDEAQGYWFSRPVPAARIAALAGGDGVLPQAAAEGVAKGGRQS